MMELVHTISQRITKYLEKVGLAERDMESSFLKLPLDDEDSLLHLQGASVSYHIAMGPQLSRPETCNLRSVLLLSNNAHFFA